MKSKRQKRIVELITQTPVGTQEELAAILYSEGMRVTQATISRDIRELHLIKTVRGDGYAYSMPKGHTPVGDETRLRRIFRDAVLKIAGNENIIVIHTLPGNANSVCSLLDAAEWDEMLGAVAGDDTIIVVVKSKDHLPGLEKKMQDMLGR